MALGGLTVLVLVVIGAWWIRVEATRAERAGVAYADFLCLVSDPVFWEGFFTREAAAGHTYGMVSERERVQLFYEVHGYPDGEEQAFAAFARYWNRNAFEAAVRRHVPEICTEEQIAMGEKSLDELLAQPGPKQ